ncbi:MAG: hypothetical protein HUJ58_08095, partial [Erysipelotrichaceae bacterium]|nr:hypothetical protein [Erysipelotrichaceae bacterium]
SVNVPSIYMTCGLQDGLLTANQRFYTCLQQLGYDVTFRTYEGAHNWDFVDERLPEVFDWLPL